MDAFVCLCLYNIWGFHLTTSDSVDPIMVGHDENVWVVSKDTSRLEFWNSRFKEFGMKTYGVQNVDHP